MYLASKYKALHVLVSCLYYIGTKVFLFYLIFIYVCLLLLTNYRLQIDEKNDMLRHIVYACVYICVYIYVYMCVFALSLDHVFLMLIKILCVNTIFSGYAENLKINLLQLSTYIYLLKSIGIYKTIAFYFI